MSRIITSKKIKIVSRGRYQHKFGVTYGPTRLWYRERVDHLVDMLKKYPDIEIIEDIGNGDTIQLNLQNVRADNTRKPVSMMEDNEMADTQEKEDNAPEQVPDASVVEQQEETNVANEDTFVENEVETEPSSETVVLDGESIAEKEDFTKEQKHQENNTNKKKKKGNHGGNGNNVAVTPREP